MSQTKDIWDVITKLFRVQTPKELCQFMTIPFFRVLPNIMRDKDVFDVHNPPSGVHPEQSEMTDEGLSYHQPPWLNTRVDLGQDSHLAVQLLEDNLFNEVTIHLTVQTSPTKVTATAHREVPANTMGHFGLSVGNRPCRYRDVDTTIHVQPQMGIAHYYCTKHRFQERRTQARRTIPLFLRQRRP